MEFTVPSDFKSAFSEDEASQNYSDTFIQNAADTTTQALTRSLIPLALKYRGKCKKYDEGNRLEKGAEWCMRHLVPPFRKTSVEAIVNAAWNIRVDLDNWPALESVKDEGVRRSEKIRVLSDITLKSFEIFEHNKRIEKFRRARKNAA